MKLEIVCHSCGAKNSRWRIKEGNLYYGSYRYYCDTCKERNTMPESK